MGRGPAWIRPVSGYGARWSKSSRAGYRPRTGAVFNNIKEQVEKSGEI